MTDITIGGQTIDADDPCAVASALRAIRLRVVAGESVAGNFQVKLAHSRDQRLAGIGILANVEGGIFIGNLLQR